MVHDEGAKELAVNMGHLRHKNQESEKDSMFKTQIIRRQLVAGLKYLIKYSKLPCGR